MSNEGSLSSPDTLDRSLVSPDGEEPAELLYRRLERVRQLRAHLPIDAGADQLYEEHVKSEDRLRYDTKTIGYLQKLLGNPRRCFVVLTGNAGHGKTHMCRRLLEADDANTGVMAGLAGDLLGRVDWKVSGSPLPVRFVKDLSEINPPEVAAEVLESLLQQDEAHVVVCANEGRLRDVAGHRPTSLRILLDALESGLEGGTTSPAEHPELHVINLNYQATAVGSGGFLGFVLDHFLNHQAAWNVCRTCAARDACPILANRNLLALSPSSPSANSTHREALVELVRIAEEGGYVLTYREALVLVAYITTGCLSCEEVERLHRRRGYADLDSHLLLEVLFERRLSGDEADVLGILRRLQRLDPGRVALRPVDERLHSELEAGGTLGSGVFGEGARQLHQKSELHQEQNAHRQTLRRERRAAWLSSRDGDDDVRRTERLGLRAHDRFMALQGNPEMRDVIATIRDLVRGLHTIQGAVGVDSMTSFHLVDPAFGRSGSHSAVIARSLRIKELELWTESSWWRKRSTRPSILDSVEWIDRRVVLSDKRTDNVLLVLDLLAFEFVMAAAHGVVMREFHSAERRRILRRLARHAEVDRDVADDIRILLRRGEGTLTVERDGTILLEKNA